MLIFAPTLCIGLDIKKVKKSLDKRSHTVTFKGIKNVSKEVKKMKTNYAINEVFYQRNGVSGAGFFTILFRMESGDFVMTLESDRPESARVLMLSDLSAAWRGDMILYDLMNVARVKTAAAFADYLLSLAFPERTFEVK